MKPAKSVIICIAISIANYSCSQTVFVYDNLGNIITVTFTGSDPCANENPHESTLEPWNGENDISSTRVQGSNEENPVLTEGAKNEQVLDPYLQVYPNPVLDELTLTYRIFPGVPLNISLSDAQGRIIRTLINISNPQGTEFTRVENIRELESGVYFITLSNREFNINKRILKI